MAKRSTIGENPLDAVIRENPLDTVVPDLSVVTKAGRMASPELAAEVQGRLQELEAGLNGLRTEVARAKAAAGEVASVKTAVTGLQGELTRVRGEVERCQAEVAPLKAEVARLQAEVAQLKGELAQVKAAQAGPGDLPWWMRGKKK